MACESAPVRIRSYALGSEPYQQLLRDYLAGRLKLKLTEPDDAQLADAIIRAADSRFAYVSFLADRHENGQLPTGDIGAGAGLYRLWLQNLEREYGRKQADAIRQVLALLAAVEEAHAWVFGAGRKIDPATGGALTPLSEQFHGLEIGLLAQLLDRDRPGAAAYDRIDPGLLFTLQTLQGVIWVLRAGEGTTRFRLALKEFLPAAKADPVVGPMLPSMHARIATRALDAAELLNTENGREPWEFFRPLSPLVEAAVHLSDSQIIVRRWRPAELVCFYVILDNVLKARAETHGRIYLLTLMASWQLRLPLESLPIDERNNFAQTLLDRGSAKAGNSDLAGAMADYEASIGIRMAIRSAMAADWPIAFQDDLAECLGRRATVSMDAGNFARALVDHDAAITLRQAICAAMGETWSASARHNLANSLDGRGSVKFYIGDHSGAMADYKAAVDLRQAALAGLGEGPIVPPLI